LANTVEFDISEALFRIVFKRAGVREWITLLFLRERAIGVVIKRTFVCALTIALQLIVGGKISGRFRELPPLSDLTYII
jgi:hypothetical protein